MQISKNLQQAVYRAAEKLSLKMHVEQLAYIFLERKD